MQNMRAKINSYKLVNSWVGLGSDAMSSASYGPEEAYLALGNHIYLAIFVALSIVLTIFVISTSYSQIIELFPTGGGGYLVASKLLSPSLGMLSGCALLIDYVLTIAISIASGVDAMRIRPSCRVANVSGLRWHVRWL